MSFHLHLDLTNGCILMYPFYPKCSLICFLYFHSWTYFHCMQGDVLTITSNLGFSVTQKATCGLGIASPTLWKVVDPLHSQFCLQWWCSLSPCSGLGILFGSCCFYFFFMWFLVSVLCCHFLYFLFYVIFLSLFLVASGPALMFFHWFDCFTLLRLFLPVTCLSPPSCKFKSVSFLCWVLIVLAFFLVPC